MRDKINPYKLMYTQKCMKKRTRAKLKVTQISIKAGVLIFKKDEHDVLQRQSTTCNIIKHLNK
jgi:hypothetical protein